MRGFIEIGVSHLTAPIEIREKLAALERSPEILLRELRGEAFLDEVAVVATCSRFEIIAWSRDPRSEKAVMEWVERRLERRAPTCVSARLGSDVVAHLFRVAAGLDSWILGESEILGQVKKAYQSALEKGFTGPHLNRIFQSAIAAGKTARAKTGLQNGIHSIGGAAALLARKIFGAERSGRTLVFGAGQAAEAVCRHLAAKNLGDVLIANRTPEKALALAREVGGRAVGLGEGLDGLPRTQVAIFSVSAPEPVVRADWLSKRLGERRGEPLFLIDLGLPRNVEPACASLPGVYVYDLDDLKNVVLESMAAKKLAKAAAEALIDDAVRECGRQLEKASQPGGRYAQAGSDAR